MLCESLHPEPPSAFDAVMLIRADVSVICSPVWGSRVTARRVVVTVIHHKPFLGSFLDLAEGGFGDGVTSSACPAGARLPGRFGDLRGPRRG